jgi:4-hydroxybenzoate polyprenyltransferase
MIYYKYLLKLFVFSNVFVSICAACLTYVTKFFFDVERDSFSSEAAVFFATISAYNFQRLVNPITGSIPQSERQQWIRLNRKGLQSLLIFSIIGFFIFFSFLDNIKSLLMLLVPASIISVWYSTKISCKIPWLKYQRLRNFPFIKIFCIAFVWVIMTVFFPLLASDNITDLNEVIWFAAERFLFLVAITLPFDIRDMEQDKQIGLKTIPIHIGVKRTKRIAYLLLLFFITSLISRNWLLQGDITTMNVMLILSAVATAFIISFSHEKRSELFFSVIVESTMVLQLLMVLLACNV